MHSKQVDFSSQLTEHALATRGVPQGVVSNHEAASQEMGGGKGNSLGCT